MPIDRIKKLLVYKGDKITDDMDVRDLTENERNEIRRESTIDLDDVIGINAVFPDLTLIWWDDHYGYNHFQGTLYSIIAPYVKRHKKWKPKKLEDSLWNSLNEYFIIADESTDIDEDDLYEYYVGAISYDVADSFVAAMEDNINDAYENPEYWDFLEDYY